MDTAPRGPDDTETRPPETENIHLSEAEYYEQVDQLAAALTPEGELPNEIIDTVPSIVWNHLLYNPLPLRYPEQTRKALGKLATQHFLRGKRITMHGPARIQHHFDPEHMESHPIVDPHLHQIHHSKTPHEAPEDKKSPGPVRRGVRSAFKALGRINPLR